MIVDGHTLPCSFADGFCKPTTKTPSTLVRFSDDFCLIFTLQDFIGRMTEIQDRYWIETDYFVHSSHSSKAEAVSGIKGTIHPHVHAPHTQNPNTPSLSRFAVFPNAQTFCVKPNPLYSTLYSDLFVTYTDGFNILTWFSDAFIALFGYPCYILTQCGIKFSTFLSVQTTLTLIIKLYKTISIKYNPKKYYFIYLNSTWFFLILSQLTW